MESSYMALADKGAICPVDCPHDYPPDCPPNDEILALKLQLEEIDVQRETQSGKWPENSPPDFELAVRDFETELRKGLCCLQDGRFAQSMDQALDADGAAIEVIRSEEDQAQRDREFALRMSPGNSVVRGLRGLREDVGDVRETLPEEMACGGIIGAAEVVTYSGESESTAGPSVLHADRQTTTRVEISCDGKLSTTEIVTHSDEDESESIADSPGPHAERQAAATEKLPIRSVICDACTDGFHPVEMIRLQCNHRYCKPCLKSLFLQAIGNEARFPPHCCRNPIDFSLVEADFSTEESDSFRYAQIEFGSTQRIYCAMRKCGKFIGAGQRTPDKASCEACGSDTCMYCKAVAHDGDCHADEALQAFKTYAEGQGWKCCFRCNNMVERLEGCNHITCRCKAEFCYRCGIQWKNCLCGDWEEGLLDRRAQQVVDREARCLLPATVRQQRVAAMAEELRENHECDHLGRFARLEGSAPRRGYLCEICGTRHYKYILSCRRCHMLVCENCRRYAV